MLEKEMPYTTDKVYTDVTISEKNLATSSKVNIFTIYFPTISLPRVHTKKCVKMSTTALFTIAKKGNNSKHLLVVGHIHFIYYAMIYNIHV